MKFCAACGAALHGGRFCPACGAAVAPASPAPPPSSPSSPTTVQSAVEPVVESLAPVRPPLRAARAQRNWPALITGLAALALLAGGITFLVLRDSGDEAVGSASSDLVSTTLPAVVASTEVAPTVPWNIPATRLAAIRDADRPLVEALVGQWVPQLSAKREGLVADGITYTLADIVALHDALGADYGALLVWSGEYVFDNSDLWVSVAPEGFATAQEALDWCVAKARDRDNCLARLVTHDPSASPTVQLQP